MRTEHSIRISVSYGECFASIASGRGCRIMLKPDSSCGTIGCPFYKPKDCRDWIKVQDGNLFDLVPPEEYFAEANRRFPKDGEASTWKIVKRRISAHSVE